MVFLVYFQSTGMSSLSFIYFMADDVRLYDCELYKNNFN